MADLDERVKQAMREAITDRERQAVLDELNRPQPLIPMPAPGRISSETALLLINGILKEQLEMALDLLEACITDNQDNDESHETMIRNFVTRLRPPKESK